MKYLTFVREPLGGPLLRPTVGRLCGRGLLPLVQHVADRQNRVPQQHPGPRVAHHAPDLVSFRWPVAVNGTLGTGGFAFSPGTAVKAVPGIRKQGRTLLACEMHWGFSTLAI